MTHQNTLKEERAELLDIAETMGQRACHLDSALSSAKHSFDSQFKSDRHPLAVEQALEVFARDLRHIWIKSAASAASKTYRSPTADQTVMTQTGRHHEFGYERDLRPQELERKCHHFFGTPPDPWCVTHLLFSSGQAAMAASLILMDRGPGLIPASRPACVAHLGAYFETTALLDLLPSLMKKVSSGDDFDAAIVEPIWCDGQFGETDVVTLANRLANAEPKPRMIIIDSTLQGRRDDVGTLLHNLADGLEVAIIRLHSGLKLFQFGFELANVGIVSVFAGDPRTVATLADRLCEIRTLLGSGLGFADVGALEFPGFLNPDASRRYETAIFEHNAVLAREIAENNRMFTPVSHPSLGPGGKRAPYCVFQLVDGSPSAYDRLDKAISSEAHARNLLFERGGSFGFRGHRFEVVRPEGGAAFLRVAMGRRPGWSCDGVVGLLRSIASTGRV
jgi:hypothetical protein